ncbi:MAG: hypothetical protein RQ847_11015 [Wenzhouxiangellaceae bacterium]|nr:hypothetical protein [Wenzhouxiangellaceae bacterium]
MVANFGPVFRRTITPVLLLLAAACASLPPSGRQVESAANEPAGPVPPAPRTELFGPGGEIPSFDELTRLTPAQERAFLDWFNARERAVVKPHRRVADYLETTLADAVLGDRTRTAAEALARRRGNCLSLALITTAVAEAAGVESDWRLTTRDPVYSSDGNVVYSANHVHTRLFDPTYETPPGHITFVRPHMLIDYFTDSIPRSGKTLKPHQIVALTYQNLAAEAFANDDLDRTFHLVLKGLEHDPDNPDLYNILGLLHKRKGAWGTAEGYYRHSLEVGGERLVTLRNLEHLLLAQDRDDDARTIARRIVALPDPDPFPLIELGDEAMQRGQTDVALDYYARAREVAPYLHEIYARIAGALFRQGRIELAAESLREALVRAGGSDKQKYYKAKYKQLGKAESTL